MNQHKQNNFCKQILFICLLITGNSIFSIAQKKVEFDGYFTLGGYVKYNDISGHSFYTAKIESKYKISDDIKVEIDIRGNSENKEIELHEASTSFKINKAVELKVGNLKKRYGVEEQVSREKLLTINKSLINIYFEPLGFVSRDPGVQLNWSTDENVNLISGIHYNDSKRVTFLSRFDFKGVLGVKKIGGGLQYITEYSGSLKNSLISSMDIQFDSRFLNSELEFFTGIDPINTYYSQIMNPDSKSKCFFAGKVLLSKAFEFQNSFITALEPFLLGCYLARDIDRIDVNSIQLNTGLNIYFHNDVRLMINGDLILTNTAWNKEERSLYGSNIIFQLQVRW